MPEKLPKGWLKTTLSEVCVRVATIQPEESPDTEFTYFDIGGIDGKSNHIVETKAFVGVKRPVEHDNPSEKATSSFRLFALI